MVECSYQPETVTEILEWIYGTKSAKQQNPAAEKTLQGMKNLLFLNIAGKSAQS